jgi:drug/metabolite transporter (DMT)-like permease
MLRRAKFYQDPPPARRHNEEVKPAPPAASEARPPSWQIVLAFAIIYFVWGSTFLAIRVGVREIPPFLMAAMRFLAAGILLYLWMRLRGTAGPTRREWASAVLLAFPIFVLDYGILFWAEQRVPSGIAAVMMATIPAFLALFEIAFLRTRRFTARLGTALLLGILGVAALANNSSSLGGASPAVGSEIDRRGLLALLLSAISWSAASVCTRRLPLLIAAQAKSQPFETQPKQAKSARAARERS